MDKKEKNSQDINTTRGNQTMGILKVSHPSIIYKITMNTPMMKSSMLYTMRRLMFTNFSINITVDIFDDIEKWMFHTPCIFIHKIICIVSSKIT